MAILYISHIALAYISLMLLLLRGVLSAKRIDWRKFKLLVIAPHLIDSLLLLSGIILFISVSYPFNSWIIAKLLFLTLYVRFAMKAFKKDQLFAIKPFILAVVSFMMILMVATVG